MTGLHKTLVPGSSGTRSPLAGLIGIGVVQAGASVLLIRSVDAFISAPASADGTAAVMGATAAVILLAVSRLAEMWQAEKLAQKIIHTQRMRLASHLLALAPSGHKTSKSEVLLRFLGEMSALRSWHMRAVPVLLIGTPVLLGGFATLVLRDVRLGLAALAPVAFALLLQAIITPRHLAAADQTRKMRTRLAGTVSRHFEALAAIQSFGRTKRALTDIERRSDDFASAMVTRAGKAGLLRAVAEFGAQGIVIAIIAVRLVFPDIEAAALAGALAFAAVLSPRLRALGRVPEQFNVARIATNRIDAFLAQPPLDSRVEGKGIARRDGALKLRKVSIEGVLENFSAQAPAGSRVLVTGANGAGKSRLLGLIAGLEDPSHGKVVIDGRDAGLRRRSSLRRIVAVAGENMPLIAGRVSDNLRCVRMSASQRDRILELCRWSDLEASLPNGARTRVGPGSPALSAGQRARIGLIRALLRKPLILVLDDIDRSLDEAGRAILDDVMARFEGTILIASHDPRWAETADIVWQLPTPASGQHQTKELSHA